MTLHAHTHTHNFLHYWTALHACVLHCTCVCVCVCVSQECAAREAGLTQALKTATQRVEELMTENEALTGQVAATQAAASAATQTAIQKLQTETAQVCANVGTHTHTHTYLLYGCVCAAMVRAWL